MNEQFQESPDPPTRVTSAIHGDSVDDGIRSACSALNFQRARGIVETTSGNASGEPTTIDAWAAAIARKAEDFGAPIVSLNSLGLSHDRDGFIVSVDDLVALPSGG